MYVGVQGVFSLLDASTVTFSHSEKRDVGQVCVVDRVNQIAMATSLTGPEDFLIALVKVSRTYSPCGQGLIVCVPSSAFSSF